MTRFALFCCYLALGIVLYLLLWGLDVLVHKLRVPPVAVVLDVCYAFTAVASAATLAYFFNDGLMEIQNILAIGIGFALPVLLFKKFPVTPFAIGKKEKPAKKKAAPQPTKQPPKRLRRRKPQPRT